MHRRKCAALIIVVLLLTITSFSLVGAALTGNEADLSPGGQAFEINQGLHGELWLNDYEADEIWAIQPATGVYTVYHGLNAPSDPRPGPGGIWWTDAENNRLALLDTTANTVTVWPVDGAISLFGTASAGEDVWVTDSFGNHVYRFTPASTELCAYTLPLAGASFLVTTVDGHLWLGDWRQDSILRLDTNTNTFTRWPLNEDSTPGGLLVTDEGDLWWADTTLGGVGRLEPATNRFTLFLPPDNARPQMLSLVGTSVWYTDLEGRVGELKPLFAAGNSRELSPTKAAANPICSNLGAGTTQAVVTTVDSFAWVDTSYPEVDGAAGWSVYQLPAGSVPFGIATEDGKVWVVDQGRQKLLQLEAQQDSYFHYLPLLIN